MPTARWARGNRAPGAALPRSRSPGAGAVPDVRTGRAGLTVQVAEFAWRVKNLVRPRGWARLGLPCQLMGAGMAFGWRDLALIDLANGHLVEDVKLGLDLCQQGKPPVFCPEAVVSSRFLPASKAWAASAPAGNMGT